MTEVAERKKVVPWIRFRSEPEQGTEQVDEKLQQLFENRNQLKREYTKAREVLDALRAEHDALAKRNAFVTSRLQGLEAMLADPRRGQSAIIYYRLDGLWKHCRGLLEKRRAELIARFEQLEKQKILEMFKAQATEQQRQLEAQFAEVDALYQEMAENLKGLHQQLRASQGLWHYFRRKRLQQEVQQAEAQVAPVVAKRDACLAELERVRDREPPPFKGLSVLARREINLQLLAYAQYLYIHFSENDFSTMARTTQLKQPHEADFGSAQECLGMERPLQEAIMRLQKDDKAQEKLHRRVDYLRKNVRFSGNGDTVPEAESLSRIVLSLGGSTSFESVLGDLPVNVLELGYWDVDQLLLKGETARS